LLINSGGNQFLQTSYLPVLTPAKNSQKTIDVSVEEYLAEAEKYLEKLDFSNKIQVVRDIISLENFPQSPHWGGGRKTGRV